MKLSIKNIAKMSILFLLFLGTTDALTAKNNDLDSLISVLPKLSNEKKMDVLFEIIKLKIIKLDRDNIKYIDMAYHIAYEQNNKIRINQIKLFYGEYWKIFGELKTASENILSAINYFETTGDKGNLTRAYRILGENYRATGLLPQALNSLYKALYLCKNINNDYELAHIYNRLSAVYFEFPKNDSILKSKFYAESSIKLVDTTIDFNLYISNLILLGAISRNFDDYLEAEKYFFRALRLAEKYDDFYNYHSILSNLVSNYILKNDINNAIFYAEKGIKLSNQKKLEPMNLFLSQLLVRLYEMKGDYKSALVYSKTESGLAQEKYLSKRDFIITNITQKYETEKKMMLLEKERTKQYYTNMIFLISSILLIGIIILYYSKQKLLNKKNDTISEQNKNLIELNATKDKFFSIIAHDLRGPINTFSNMTDLIDSDFDNLSDEEKKELIMLMKNSSNNIAELLDNLLTWSRTQRGKNDFEPSSVELSIIIDPNINLLQIPAEKKNISLSSDYSDDLMLFADVNMLSTVLRNLISNAIKFTPSGGEILIKSEKKDDMLIISIQDNGVGIEAERISRLFKIDENITTLGTNNERGTGLGLIICKEFVERNGGSIRVESEVGKGSTFSFSIPIYKKI